MMDKRLIPIDKNFIFNTLHNTLELSLGKVKINDSSYNSIKMNAKTAFIYSVLTGHGYLDPNESGLRYQMTKDQFRIFNQAEEYKFQNGIFLKSEMSFFSTPFLETKEKPYILESPKYLLVIKYKIYNDLLDKLKSLINKCNKNNLNPGNFIICPLRETNGISEMESFFEFIVASYFKRQGYITDTQIPFYYGVGTPDIAGYKIPSITNILRKDDFIESGGTVIDLMISRIFNIESKNQNNKNEKEAIVFEVKTSQTKAPQMKKYTDEKIFNKAYEVIPCEKKPETYAGLISFNQEGRMVIKESENKVPFDREKQKKYFDWLIDYLKFYLLTNLSNTEFEQLLDENNVEQTKTQIKEWIKNTNLKELSRLIKGIIGDL